MNSRRLLSGIVAATCLASLAACRSGGTEDGAATSAPPTSQAADAGQTPQQALAAAQTEPSGIATKTKLPKAPEKGLRVAFLSCSAPACSLLNPGFESAAKALGWKPTVITYDSAQPGQAMQQAINAGYKYIATTSITLNTITPQLQQAKAKGIAIFGAYTGDTPRMEVNGLYGVAANVGTSRKAGKLMADWTIVDSKSDAHTVYVSLPIYPSLVAQGEAVKAEYKRSCPKCTVDVLGLSGEQVGSGQTPSAVVSYLKSHPDTNYVHISFNDLSAGVAAAIKSAGLAGKVKVVGTQGMKSQLQNVINGSEAAWTILPEPYVMWTVVDWMARLNVGALTQKDLDATSTNPIFLVDSAAEAKARLAADGGLWAGPKNYEADFKALWGV